jgi:hypothetical protein
VHSDYSCDNPLRACALIALAHRAFFFAGLVCLLSSQLSVPPLSGLLENTLPRFSWLAITKVGGRACFEFFSMLKAVGGPRERSVCSRLPSRAKLDRPEACSSEGTCGEEGALRIFGLRGLRGTPVATFGLLPTGLLGLFVPGSSLLGTFKCCDHFPGVPNAGSGL